MFSLFRWLSIAGLALVAPWAAAGSDRNCVSADVPFAVMLPDGSVHAPGRLTICLVRTLSPAQGFHTLYLDGWPTGTFLSRLGRAEDPDGSRDTLLVFRRNGRSELVLEGYGVPGQERWNYYHLPPIADAARATETREADAPAEEMLVVRAHP